MMTRIVILHVEVPDNTNLFDLGSCIKLEIKETFHGRTLFAGNYPSIEEAKNSLLFNNKK